MVHAAKIIITDKFSKHLHKNWIRENHYICWEVASEAVSHRSEAEDKGLAQEMPLSGLGGISQLIKIINLKRI